jgi:hypothetical protein
LAPILSTKPVDKVVEENWVDALSRGFLWKLADMTILCPIPFKLINQWLAVLSVRSKLDAARIARKK